LRICQKRLSGNGGSRTKEIFSNDHKDTVFVASAMALKAKLWSGDKKTDKRVEKQRN
jgi:predicted nucleic acid-binding protein